MDRTSDDLRLMSDCSDITILRQEPPPTFLLFVLNKIVLMYGFGLKPVSCITENA